VNSKLSNGLSFLATVGSTAPFVGLFGTVYGILNALVQIGMSGQPSIDKVAGPVGEALIMTALGLAVAVPAVFGYNILLKRNKAIQDVLREFTGDLEAYLIGGVRPELSHGARPAAAPAAKK
jgi:biopolymer transport protein ExbB